MSKIVDIIKNALDVGCEELPSGCDDLSVEQGFIENNGNDQSVRIKLIFFKKFMLY